MDNLNQLRTFLAVFRHGSVSKAAEQLNLTQPAVTKQLQQLEARLERQLFTRVPRGVVATPAAHELARRVQTHLEALEQVTNTLKIGSNTLEGTVFIGGPAEFLGEKVLPALARLPAQGIQIRARLEQPEVLKTELLNGALDLAVFTVRRSDAQLESTPLYLEELVLVGNRAWAERLPRGSLSAAVLETMPLIAYAEDLPMLRRYWRKVFNASLDATASLVVPDLRALERAAIAGYGITVLPRYLVEQSFSSGALMPLHTPPQPPSNQLYLGWNKKALHPRVILVRDALQRASSRW
jgi:DNA-binding transcriptional LysR family regulator